MRKKPRYMEYCPEHYEEIENYQLAKADNFVGWVCHHRNGVEFSKEWLIKNNMYYNRTDPHEFKFVRTEEHTSIHKKNKPLSELNKKNIGIALKKSDKAKAQRAKLAESLRGKKRPADVVERAAIARRGIPNWKNSQRFKGAHWKLINGKRVWYYDE